MGNFGFSELLVIGAIVFFLFGAKRIPEFARSLGQGLRIFKAEMNRKEGEDGIPPATDSVKKV